MAEYCLDCFNESIGDKKLTEKDVVTELDLCESCGEWKQCVVVIKERNFLIDLKDMILNVIGRILSKKRAEQKRLP